MRIWLPVLVVLLVIQPVMADNAADAEKVSKKAVNSVLTVLRTKGLSKEEKRSKIEKIINPVFDFQLMAKLALGRKHWLRFNKEERKTFTELFVARLKDSYLEKVGLFADEEVEFKSVTEVKKKVHILAVIISKDDEISILYKLRKNAGKWKIYDFEVQGVSMISTYRSQYNEHFGSKGTITDLLEKMKKRDEAE